MKFLLAASSVALFCNFRGQKNHDTPEAKRAEEMEGRVVELFHPDYIKLLNTLK